MILATAVAVAAAVSSPFSGTPNPSFQADTYQLTALTRGGFVRHTVAGPERFLTEPTDRTVQGLLARDRQLWIGATATAPGTQIKARYQAAPDVDGGPDDLGLRLARFAVTEARAGRLVLVPGSLDNRAVLDAEVDLPANGCRDLTKGKATIWLTRTTLLPRRLEVKRRGKTLTWTYRFAGFNQILGCSIRPGWEPTPSCRQTASTAPARPPQRVRCRTCRGSRRYCRAGSGWRRRDGRRAVPAPG